MDIRSIALTLSDDTSFNVEVDTEKGSDISLKGQYGGLSAWSTLSGRIFPKLQMTQTAR